MRLQKSPPPPPHKFDKFKFFTFFSFCSPSTNIIMSSLLIEYCIIRLSNEIGTMPPWQKRTNCNFFTFADIHEKKSKKMRVIVWTNFTTLPEAESECSMSTLHNIKMAYVLKKKKRMNFYHWKKFSVDLTIHWLTVCPLQRSASLVFRLFLSLSILSSIILVVFCTSDSFISAIKGQNGIHYFLKCSTVTIYCAFASNWLIIILTSLFYIYYHSDPKSSLCAAVLRFFLHQYQKIKSIFPSYIIKVFKNQNTALYNVLCKTLIHPKGLLHVTRSAFQF